MQRIALTLAACISGTVLAAAPDTATRALLSEGHIKRALAVLEPRVKANPNDAEAAALLSRIRLTLGAYDEAVRLAEIAVRIEPNNADYHWRLAEAVGRQAQRAGVLKQFGLARRFRKEAEATVALDPRLIDARIGLMTFYAVAPGVVGGDTKKALQTIDEIAAIDRASGFLARVRYLEETKGTGDIDGLLKQAIDAGGAPEVAIESRGRLMNRHLAATPPRFDQAELVAKDLVKIAPGRQGGYSGLAYVYAMRDQFAELDAVLADAERAIPDNLVPYFQAGRALQTRAVDLPRAERYLKKYLSQPPEGGMPGAAVTHWRLGLVYEKQGRKPEAILALQEALKLNPDLEQAQKDLKRLK